MSFIRHFIKIIGMLFVILGIPFLCIGYTTGLFYGNDAVSSASVIIEQPSGEYVVLINKDIHTDEDNLSKWEEFFRGNETDYIFEDLSCLVIDSDETGYDLASSFMSRLPENQMTLRTEKAMIVLSKIRCGIYDVAVFSREFYEAYGPVLPDDANALVIEEDGI